MKTGFVILKKGFEYNDEINSPNDGGHPELIVFSREDAKKIVDELNSKEFKQSSLNDFCYDVEEILNVDAEKYDKFNQSLIEKYGPITTSSKWESAENRLHPMANTEEVFEYCKMVNFSFYEVVETNLDVSSLRNKQINDILN